MQIFEFPIEQGFAVTVIYFLLLLLLCFLFCFFFMFYRQLSISQTCSLSHLKSGDIDNLMQEEGVTMGISPYVRRYVTYTCSTGVTDYQFVPHTLSGFHSRTNIC